MNLTLDETEIWLHELGCNPRRTGDHIKANCPNPAHEDRTASFSVSLGRDGQAVSNCLAGCTFAETRPPAKQTTANNAGLTVAAFGQAKKLPEAFLKTCGVEDATGRYGKPEIHFRHYAHDGTLANRFQARWSMGDKGCWGGVRGGVIYPYGLERLVKSREHGYVVLIEGASDYLTLIYHGYPAMGFPGASMTDKLQAGYLKDLAKIYIVKEPDRGGEIFVAGLVKSLRKFKTWQGKAFVIILPEKDVSDLHCKDPDNFKTTFQAALDSAKSIDTLGVVSAVAEITNPKGWQEAHTKYPLTDAGVAERIAEQHSKKMAYAPSLKRWIVYTGNHWDTSPANHEYNLAIETARSIHAEADEIEDPEISDACHKFAAQSEQANRLDAGLKLARGKMPVSMDDLDGDPLLLNVSNGTLDLRRDGKLKPHNPRDLISRVIDITYDDNASCDNWLKFLDRVLDSNDDLIRFIQLAIGYSLTGRTDEQALFFLHGQGANGKSVFLALLGALLGEYGVKSGSGLIVARRQGEIPNDIARLRGVRVAIVAETDSGARLNEAQVKELTGGDKLNARFLHGEFFDFEPSHKLWLASNHKPVIRGTDLGIWRRIRLIPFAVTIPEKERDPKLIDKLKLDLPGILSWAVRGCRLWQEDGNLGAPDDVIAAVNEYRAEMDTVGLFLEEACISTQNARIESNKLYTVYVAWCEQNGVKSVSKTRLGLDLKNRGFESGRDESHRFWRGIGLRDDCGGNDTF